MCLSEHLAMKTCGGNGDIDPRIINFLTRQLCPVEIIPRYKLVGAWVAALPVWALGEKDLGN
jgi:hypothetical protein